MLGTRRVQAITEKWLLKPEDQWIWTSVEPIVSEELWDQCNLILDEQRERFKRPAKKPVQLFAGLAFCQCGRKMYVPSNSPKYTCHGCRNNIPIVDREALYHEQLKRFLLSPSDVISFFDEADRIAEEKKDLLHTMEQRRRSSKSR